MQFNVNPEMLEEMQKSIQRQRIKEYLQDLSGKLKQKGFDNINISLSSSTGFNISYVQHKSFYDAYVMQPFNTLEELEEFCE